MWAHYSDPHAPYRWSQRLWTTEFRPSELSFGKGGVGDLADAGSMEDLLERLGRGPKISSSGGSRSFPLPPCLTFIGEPDFAALELRLLLVHPHRQKP